MNKVTMEQREAIVREAIAKRDAIAMRRSGEADYKARYEYIRARYLSDDMEAPFLPDGATYADTPEEFDAAIDAAIDYEAGKQADEDRYEDPSAIFGDPRA
jgi:hypothetical protein